MRVEFCHKCEAFHSGPCPPRQDWLPPGLVGTHDTPATEDPLISERQESCCLCGASAPMAVETWPDQVREMVKLGWGQDIPAHFVFLFSLCPACKERLGANYNLLMAWVMNSVQMVFARFRPRAGDAP